MQQFSLGKLILGWGVLLALSGPVRAAEVDYVTQVKPLLTRVSRLSWGVEAGRFATAGDAVVDAHRGDSGAALVAGDPDASLILQRVTEDEDARMPPVGEGARLTAEEITILRDWIAGGAAAPDEEPPPSPLDHWAFRRIERPQLPTMPAGKTLPNNPIDRFLAAKRLERNLQTQPAAKRSIRIRRLYLDLIGMPPTRGQLRDERPWEEIVDELLASPHHGERWGRHWMDVWRYSDWYGLGDQLRNSQKHLWHWRDWIVDSLNDDKGYDRMIQEMLAGDELAPDDPQVVAGTGFLARNYYLFNRTTWLDSTIEHTGKAFLGLTLNCAKCHDHKYDPISQLDYYQLRALFEPHQVRLDPVPGVTDLEQDGLPRVFDDHLDAETLFHVKGDPKNPDKDREITPQVPEIFVGFQPDITSVSLPASAFAPGVRDYVQRDQLQAAERAVADAETALAKAKEKLDSLPQETSPQAEPEDFEFADEFDAPNPDAWELVGKNWEYREGSLVQTAATRDAEFARLKMPLPRDFEAICRYTTTGGTTYKSVTFRFDRSEDGQFANFVYSSAHAPGPKVQIAYTRNGQHAYPAEGVSARPIEVGREYELRFAVRDRLVNVWLDNEFQVAYLLPDRSPEGSFALSGFDATVAFHSLRLRTLPEAFELAEARNGMLPTVENVRQVVDVAAARVRLRQAELAALRATCDADRAQFFRQAKDGEDAAKVAATKQAESQLAVAEFDRLQAGSDEQKVKAAAAKAQKARERLAEIEAGKVTYTSLRVSLKALETPAHKEGDYSPTYPETSTGRRLALAGWVTSRDNPLTARVAVNHVWMRHFGEPLVDSVFDFGLRTRQPRHAELLDYLAAEFIDSGWSFKHLHRLMVTSQAYQLSCSVAGADSATLAADPVNQDYWRMNTRRMDAQTIRDSLLHLGGTIDLTVGGPSVDVGNSSRRRSLYFKHSRDQQDKFLSMFDDADLLQCYRRSESIVPQQALALSNSELSLAAAADIANRVFGALPDEADEGEFVRAAFETILARLPTESEVSECLQFAEELRGLLSEPVPSEGINQRVRTRLVHSLLSHNDFISIR